MAYYLVLSDRVLRDVVLATKLVHECTTVLICLSPRGGRNRGEQRTTTFREGCCKPKVEKKSPHHTSLLPKASTDRFPQVVVVPQDSSLLSIIRVVWGFNISLSNDVLQAPYAGCMGQSQAVLWQCGCDEREVAMNPERHDSQAQYWES